jgi:hypothetical protein
VALTTACARRAGRVRCTTEPRRSSTTTTPTICSGLTRSAPAPR